MTKVDFYILPTDSIEDRHRYACRLAEKAYRLGHQIYIHSDDNAQANAIDQLLWSFRPDSFVPHQVESDSTDSSHQVEIGFADAKGSAAQHNGLLINLSNSVPEFFSRFNRVSEIVVQHPDIKESTRANYRFYRDRGYALQTHTINQADS